MGPPTWAPISVSFLDTRRWEDVRYSNCLGLLMRLRIPSSQVATRKQADHPATPSPQHSTHNPFPKVDPRSSLPFFFFIRSHYILQEGFFLDNFKMHLGVNDNPPNWAFRPPHVRKNEG